MAAQAKFLSGFLSFMSEEFFGLDGELIAKMSKDDDDLVVICSMHGTKSNRIVRLKDFYEETVPIYPDTMFRRFRMERASLWNNSLYCLHAVQGRIGTYNFVVPGLSEPLF